MKFNLEKAIKQWRADLRKNPSFEDGDVEELVSHLRDQIQKFKAKGLFDKEAFQMASEGIGEPETIGDELYKTKTTRIDAIPSWKQSQWIPNMLPNYIKIALRNFVKNKEYSLVNLISITIGISCCILITLYIQHELSYDQFHTDAERIYRLENLVKDRETGELMNRARVPITWAKAIEEEIQGIEKIGRLSKSRDRLVVTYQNQSFNEDDFVYADNEIFSILSFNFLKGSPQNALDRPNTIVISEEKAKAYFGNDDPIGKTLEVSVSWYGSLEFEVTGVVESFPSQSHIQRDIYLSFITLENELFADISENWGIHFYYTYVLLGKGTAPSEIEAKLSSFVDRNYEAEDSQRYSPYLRSITDIHLYSHTFEELSINGNIQYIYLFAGIAVLVLLIATSNFVNLATARSIERAKEVGVRKTMGANRAMLVRQFLSESIVYFFVGIFFSLALILITLPYFNQAIGLELSFGWLELLRFGVPLLFFAFIVGGFAGLYPALFLASFDPIKVFKNYTGDTSESGSFRKVIVTAQFIISMVLVVGTVVIYNQLNFINQKSLGFEKEALLIIPLSSNESVAKSDLIKRELQQLPSVKQASAADHAMGTSPYYADFQVLETPLGNSTHQMARFYIDYEFFETMNIQLLAGRTLSNQFATDTAGAFIINESALRQMGWSNSEAALGKGMRYTRPGGLEVDGQIVGVVQNFHVESLHTEIVPMVMEYWPEEFSVMNIRLATGQYSNAINFIQASFEKVIPGFPFDFFFQEDYLNSLYRSEQQMGKVVLFFSMLAIITACFGLFGLVSFNTKKRTKEVGVRKVLGAEALDILLLFSKDYIRLIAVSAVIALPLSYYLMRYWLRNFSYQTGIGSGIYLISIVIVVTTAFSAISYHSLKVAYIKPVNSLKDE